MWQILPRLWMELMLNPWGLNRAPRQAPTLDNKDDSDG